MKKKSSVAILISTYDGARDLWKPLEESYLRHWNNIKYPIYLTTNHYDFDSDYFTPLKVGDELSWSDNIIKSLSRIDEDYILLTFDDLFIRNDVDNVKIEKHIDWAIEKEVNYFQLFQSIGKKEVINKFVSEKKIHSQYRNATVFSLWNKKILIELLRKDENAWEFETKGNIRSFQYPHFYTSRENLISYYNGVVKGKWNPSVRKKLLSLDYTIDIEARQVFSLKEFVKYQAVKCIYTTLCFFRNRFLK